MSRVELVGYLASALVFATFYTKAMPALRLVAIASNIAFIVYGYLGGLAPIVLLHAGLLPLNAWRLCQMLRSQGKIGGATPGAGPTMRFLRIRQVPQRRPDRARRSLAGAPCGLLGAEALSVRRF
jgi:CRP/FNR family transcriptional regulator, cyclic AMP receptor protein